MVMGAGPMSMSPHLLVLAEEPASYFQMHSRSQGDQAQHQQVMAAAEWGVGMDMDTGTPGGWDGTPQQVALQQSSRESPVHLQARTTLPFRSTHQGSALPQRHHSLPQHPLNPPLSHLNPNQQQLPHPSPSPGLVSQVSHSTAGLLHHPANALRRTPISMRTAALERAGQGLPPTGPAHLQAGPQVARSLAGSPSWSSAMTRMHHPAQQAGGSAPASPARNAFFPYPDQGPAQARGSSPSSAGQIQVEDVQTLQVQVQQGQGAAGAPSHSPTPEIAILEYYQLLSNNQSQSHQHQHQQNQPHRAVAIPGAAQLQHPTREFFPPPQPLPPHRRTPTPQQGRAQAFPQPYPPFQQMQHGTPPVPHFQQLDRRASSASPRVASEFNPAHGVIGVVDADMSG